MGAAMRFPLSSELLLRLPRHPDWRYERINGEAFLSPRPRPLHLRRPTALPVPETRVNAEVRELDAPSDRDAVAALLLQTWLEEDPYRSLEAPAELLGSEVERGLDTAELGAVAVGADSRVCAAVLVHGGRSHVPMLNWLTVARDAREGGLATELLRLITTTLLARGINELNSAASAANTPSLRWHLSRGFQLAEDPVRQVLRAAGGAPRECNGVKPD
jgi:GNAT superfamily N-acetyltransferase